jgi:hypothetical protein
MASQLPFAGGDSRTEAKRFPIVVGKRKEDGNPREKGRGLILGEGANFPGINQSLYAAYPFLVSRRKRLVVS